ncbi:flagellar hook-associated protein FlgK [Rhizobium sp. FY34]|uniref:flagellar hook-associated protein FlgK n=1 Tax=Rhizobium sp. FY34 TaxID=2562309 RepID=UPI0010C12841|nr:flagellar hook-associated protein FlgK [Rhizobium sp. FY34]
MSLTTSLSTAQSMFNTTGAQTATTSKNIANAENANYVRRSNALVTAGNGALIASTDRAQNDALFRQTITATSVASGQATVVAGVTEIRSQLGGNEYDNSPSAHLSDLADDLNAYAASPSESTLASSTVASAQETANYLNTTSNEVQAIRSRADADIKDDVDELNNLLAQFEAANNDVVRSNVAGEDASDALDTRDTLVKQISQIIGVSTSERTNGDMALYTSDGTTLFETVPRQVSFTPTTTYTASVTGNAVYIDGVQLSPGVGADTSASGSLQGHLQIRDQIAPDYQAQLDEIARGLIVTFAETGPDGTLTPLAGLFTNGVDDSVPTAATVVPGLAASISVNQLAIDNPVILRDGGMNGGAYVMNTTGGSGYSAYLDSLAQGMVVTQSFDPATGVSGSLSLMTYASASTSWLEETRSKADAANETKSAMSSRSLEAYSSETGVSIDEEMSLLLDIEQSYKAAAKLVSTIDEMMAALLEAAG